MEEFDYFNKENSPLFEEISQVKSDFAAPETSRFPTLSEVDIEDLRKANVKRNTVLSTKTWMNVWSKWCEARGISQAIELFPYSELDNILTKFYAEVKTANGGEYEPESLRVMQSSIDRYLKGKGYGESIISSRHFEQSIKTLNGKAASLRQQGKGKRPNKAEALTPSEEETLWRKGSLGDHSAVALTNANFKCLSEQMGLRGRQDHYDAFVEDFTIRKHDDGSESVVFSENPTKTRSGGLKIRYRSTKQEMWSTDGGPQDPVRLFKLWLSKRPVPLQNEGPLYLSIIPRPKNQDVWYAKVRMGHNTIGKLMRRMTSLLESSTAKKLTNHSTRKTVVQKLKSAGQPRHKIIEITGHASEASLDDYDVISEDEHRHLSHIISGYSGSQTTATATSTATSLPCASSFTVCELNKTQTSIPPAQVVQQIARSTTSNAPPQGLSQTLQSVSPSSMIEYVGNDVVQTASKNPVSSALAPVTIAYNNCVFNISNNSAKSEHSPPKKARRTIIFDSDSE